MMATQPKTILLLCAIVSKPCGRSRTWVTLLACYRRHRRFSVRPTPARWEGRGIDSHSISWAMTVRYSLPFPLALPIINIILSLVVPFLAPIMTTTIAQAEKGIRGLLFSYAWYFTTLIPWILLVVAAMYGTVSDMSRCGMESQWKHMFQRKDDAGIRAIQNGLRCCGFNSLHDRAWPFPAHDVDVRACERTQGYTNSCADRWQRQESTVAGLTVLASILNWVLLVSCDPE